MVSRGPTTHITARALDLGGVIAGLTGFSGVLTVLAWFEAMYGHMSEVLQTMGKLQITSTVPIPAAPVLLAD